jgi:hypothetical protein
MKTPEQPVFSYQVGGSLGPEHPSYVERQADLELYEGLKNRDFCYVLINSRQTGKTSLIQRTKWKLEAEKFRCVLIDLTSLGNDYATLENWCRAIFYELVKAFKLSINRKSWWDQRAEQSEISRLNEFFDDVLLKEVLEPIVIFIDEIDTVLSLNFAVDDFFSWIRSRYNKEQPVDSLRHYQPQSLCFCLVGVADPNDLMQDKNRTPFNIGTGIRLTGFQLHEAQPLVMGLENKLSNPSQVLQEILFRTGGQPFLTQKLCQIVATDVQSQNFLDQNGKNLVERLVKERIIDNWESQDHPQHLRTIRDRLKATKSQEVPLLKLYQRILEQGWVKADVNNAIKLELSGLVVNENGHLKVYNPIYKDVFNEIWVKKRLSSLNPYEQNLIDWKEADYDPSSLLKEKDLEEALSWQEKNEISEEERKYLQLSKAESYRIKYEQDKQMASNRIKIRLNLNFKNDLPEIIEAILPWAWAGNNLFLIDHVCNLLIRFKDDYLVKKDNKREVRSIIDVLLREHLINKKEDHQLNEYLRNIGQELLKGDNLEQVKSRLEFYETIIQLEEFNAYLPNEDGKKYPELLKSLLVINQEGNLEIANELYRSKFGLDWVKKELKNLSERQQLPEPVTRNIISIVILLIVIVGILYVKKLWQPESHDPLIKSAIDKGKDNLVVPDAIDDFCEIPENSSSIKTARYWVNQWLKDPYWGKQVKIYLRKKQPTFSCPAAPENLDD